MKKHHSELDIFDDQQSPFFAVANNTLAIATLVSILAIVLETVNSVSNYQPLFMLIEYTTTLLFTAEYFLRLWLAKSKSRYAFSFFGIVDLLAIIPTFLGIANLTFLKATRSLRILRLLRMVRLAKLANPKKSLPHPESIYGLNVEIYGIALLLSILLLGSVLFVVEGHTSYAKDIPSGMYWAFKVLLGGMPFEQPLTIAGTFVLVSARFVSLVLLGLLLSLMGTVMRKLLIGTEGDK